MGFIAILLTTIVLVIWLYFLWSRRRFYKAAWQLPGPIGWPFIGLGFQMMYPEKFLHYMEYTARKYKSPFISWMGTSCFLYVNEPETVGRVMNSSQCINKGDFYRFVASAIGDGLFTSSSPRWNLHRRLINPAFGRTILNDFLPIFNAEANVLIEKLKSSEGAHLEIYEIIKRSVLEAACQTTMGKRMNFQNDGSAIIFDSYNSITEVCVRRMLSPWLYPDIIFRQSRLFAIQQKVVNILYDFVENLLGNNIDRKKTVNSTENNQLNGNDENDLSNQQVTRFNKSKAIFIEQIRNSVDQGQLTWDDVRDEANVIIAATFETTSTALYFVCLCLAMHPEYQDKVHDELIELFPENCDSKHDITNDHLDRMIYTEMVINEAMRLFAPVPMVLRRVSEEDFQLNDVALPVGTQIGIDIFNMHRSEEVWGSKAKQFCPDLHFGPDAVQRHPFAFVPFTKGLRMCIGYRYALMLMKIFVAKIFYNFCLHTDAKIEDLIIKGTISLKLQQYPLCQVFKRHKQTSN